MRSEKMRRRQRRHRALAGPASIKSSNTRKTDQRCIDRWAYYAGRCWICGQPATSWDHVKPLSAGGCWWPSNLRPACVSCNEFKGNKWPLDETFLRLLRLRGQLLAAELSEGTT